MSRLTNHFDYCECFECNGYDEEFAKENMCKYLNTSRDKCLDRNIYNKLVEYEDLEEQGLLLKLPCKVGDKIYQIEDNYIYEFDAKSIDIRKENEEYIFCIEYGDYKLDDIGKTVFLTKEEAEKELKRLEGAE